jgi:hypothetical protein
MLSCSSECYDLLEGVYYDVVVVLEGNSHMSMMWVKVRGGRYRKLIDSRYILLWDRYHKNAIIHKDISLLVGIVFYLSFSSSFSIARTKRFLHSPLAHSNWNYDLIPQMIAALSERLKARCPRR